MSLSMEQPRKVIPAQLGFLAIYNPSLGTTDETLENQIVYYSSPETRDRSHQRNLLDQKSNTDQVREQNNEQLRQIGLAQGMVEFGRSFSDGRAVDIIETERSRIILHELEAGWWILASINLTILPSAKTMPNPKGNSTKQQEVPEYSSREVEPAILLLGDLLRAHSTFLLHHASSMSALFVRTRRSKFVGILGRYWDTFLSTWNVLMHGNPANNLYGGIKIAACGELGVGVGEEDRGSGEREVLEGFVGRIDGLVDVIVARFGDSDSPVNTEKMTTDSHLAKPSVPWLGSGNEPGSEDGAIFLGTGALSRKSLRDVSHWVEDLYRWGPYAYGVVDNPTSTRRTKKSKQQQAAGEKELSLDAKMKSLQVHGSSMHENNAQQPAQEDSMTTIPPMPMNENDVPDIPKAKKKRPSLPQGPASFTSTDSESNKTNKFIRYMKFGYGSHWSLGGTPKIEVDNAESPDSKLGSTGESSGTAQINNGSSRKGRISDSPLHPRDDNIGHYLIGLMGDIENDDEDTSDLDPEEFKKKDSLDYSNTRLLLRTLTVELEREEDARAEAEISIDLGSTDNDPTPSKYNGSEHTATSNTSFESQDRNKTKKLRVVVYVNRPFIFVFLFELRTVSLALTSLYRSLHYQIGPLLKPLLASTNYRASKPEMSAINDSSTPIYDLVWDPRLLTINSTIPNIPDPLQSQVQVPGSLPWSRIEALNTHMQIINTYVASCTTQTEMERTCKTSRGWWVVWTRIPDSDASKASLTSGPVRIPGLFAEDSIETQNQLLPKQEASRGTSTVGASMNSGPAHPFLDVGSNSYEITPKDKEIFLIRRASDYVAAKPVMRFSSSSSAATSEASWTSNPGKLAQGIGVDTKRYIEALLNLNR